MLIVGIDTSGQTASCALCSEDAILAQNTFVTKRTHSQVILPMVKKMLCDADKSLEDIDGFAAISGPGSYTGLRIGIAAVKGICFGTGKPCVGISALEALAYNFRGFMGQKIVVCAVMHARQDLVYTARFYVEDGKVIRDSEDVIIPLSQAFDEVSKINAPVYAVGDYAEKFCESYPYDRKNVFLAPPLLRSNLASSLCFAAIDKGFGSPDDLNADYLQITKAEKDLLEK